MVDLSHLPPSNLAAQLSVKAAAATLDPAKAKVSTADVCGACAVLAQALGAVCIYDSANAPGDAKAVYVVVPTFAMAGPAALPPTRQQVTPAWLRRCVLDDQLHAPTASALFCPLRQSRAGATDRLHAQRVCPSAVTEAERTIIADLCGLLGMRFSERLTRSCTALVVPRLTDSDKCKKAIEWGIPCVTKGWLEECARQHALVPAEGEWLAQRDDADDGFFEAAAPPRAPSFAEMPAPAPAPAPVPPSAPAARLAAVTPPPPQPVSAEAMRLLHDAQILQQEFERRPGAGDRRTSLPAATTTPTAGTAPGPEARMRATRRAPAHLETQLTSGAFPELSQRVVYTRSNAALPPPPAASGAGSQGRRKRSKKAAEKAAMAAAEAAATATTKRNAEENAAPANGAPEPVSGKRTRLSRGTTDPSPTSPPKRPKKAWLTGAGDGTTSGAKAANQDDDTLAKLGIL